MKTLKFLLTLMVGLGVSASAFATNESFRAGDFTVKTFSIERGMTKAAKACLDCHQDKTPGITNDWAQSRHAHVGVSCLDCHQVPKDSPAATQHEDMVGGKIYISSLVSPATCGRCHSEELDQFQQSGHVRAYKQIIPKDNLHALTNVHEGRNHPTLKGAPYETGCMQCHGTKIKVDKNGQPTADTWPNAGMGNVYPDGSVGSCTACHTRHKFSIEEARHPNACASCHLGPDHPNIEIYENSKHGHIFLSGGSTDTKWDTAADAWEPGDYRSPTCATCHMSGIGKLKTTHNITERLHWNLWAKQSKVRNSSDVMSPLLGNGVKGRKLMKQVCNACHGAKHTDNFFIQGDKAVMLYNEAYWIPAKKMYDDLKLKHLLKDNPWTDKFQKTFYYLWHHEGRRARQGAMMGAPDYAHWHGFFELQQDMYELTAIYDKRMKTGKIED